MSPRARAAVALAAMAPVPTLGVLAAFLVWPGPVGQLVFGLSKAWLLLFPLWWWRRVEAGTWSWSPARRGGFGLAVALGLVMGAAVVVTYAAVRARGWVDVPAVRALVAGAGLGTPAVFLLGALYWVTLNSILEEYVYRWFVWRQCETLGPGLPAVLGAAAVFTTHHTIMLTAQFGWLLSAIGTVGVFAGGATWSWLYARTGSVWPPYVSHALVDVAIFAVGWHLMF